MSRLMDELMGTYGYSYEGAKNIVDNIWYRHHFNDESAGQILEEEYGLGHLVDDVPGIDEHLTLADFFNEEGE